MESVVVCFSQLSQVFCLNLVEMEVKLETPPPIPLPLRGGENRAESHCHQSSSLALKGLMAPVQSLCASLCGVSPPLKGRGWGWGLYLSTLTPDIF